LDFLLERLEDRQLLSVMVATDQTDYAPGSTALITGSGFQPGDTINLQVVHTDGNPDVSPPNDPWTITADDSGNISSSWYVDPASSTGDSLELIATDPATGDSAVADFTDSVTSFSPTSIAEGSGSFTLTVNGGGFTGTSQVTWTVGTTVTTLTRLTQSGTVLTATVPPASWQPREQPPSR
jgi:hypothetical protein